MSKMIGVTCPECKRVRQMRLSNYNRGGNAGLCLPCHNRTHQHNQGHRGYHQQTRRANHQTSEGFYHEGYHFVRAEGHPRARKDGFIKRAILVLEAKLGRYLLSSEHSHHLNGIRDDDRPENLIALTNSEHARLHMTARPNIKNRYEMALPQQ